LKRSNVLSASTYIIYILIVCLILQHKYTGATSKKGVLKEEPNGLMGFIGGEFVPVSDPSYGKGFSFYTMIFNLTSMPLANLQIGAPFTWITPNNNDFNNPLCPIGTYARKNWPERGPTWNTVMQTIEGGPGVWGSTQFPAGTKFRINGTPDCYNTSISSHAWQFGDPNPLSPERMGLAQVSNRIIAPPDGFTFNATTNGEFLGVAWMALPILPKPTNPVKTGPNSWGLFFNSKNYAGLVAMYTANVWSRMSQRDPSIAGRGFDNRFATMQGGGMEVNAVPNFVARDARGVLYTKIPRLQFPVDANNQTVLMQGNYFYAAAALYTPLQVALAQRQRLPRSFLLTPKAAVAPRCTANPLFFTQGKGKQIPLVGFEHNVQTFAAQRNGKCVIGLQWKNRANAGFFPEYFKQVANKRVAVSAQQVPAATKLQQQKFAADVIGQDYMAPADIENNKYWSTCMQRGLSQQVTLVDNSKVLIYWCKFIEQPSILSLHLSTRQASKLQATIERIHREWRDLNLIPPLEYGQLARMDENLLVTPPPGCEIGYVPIVYEQRYPVPNTKTIAHRKRKKTQKHFPPPLPRL
jgi:hypothetical protein